MGDITPVETNLGINPESKKNTEQVKSLSASIVGRRVDFGKTGEGEGLAWGIEVEIDITDSIVRSRLQELVFTIPPQIKKVVFLDLAPQEALEPKLRTIRSQIKPRSIRGSSAINIVAAPAYPINPKLERFRRTFNLPNPVDHTRLKALHNMVTWAVGISGKNVDKFNDVLKNSKGESLVIVHGHSSDLSGMGEQYPDQTTNEEGRIIQKRYNLVPIDSILERYNDPNKYSAIVLHGCNSESGDIKAKNVPVFYPRTTVSEASNPGFIWSKSGGASLPE